MCSTVTCPAALSACLVVLLQIAPPSAAGQGPPSQQSVHVSAGRVAALLSHWLPHDSAAAWSACSSLASPAGGSTRLLSQPLQALHLATLRCHSCHRACHRPCPVPPFDDPAVPDLHPGCLPTRCHLYCDTVIYKAQLPCTIPIYPVPPLPCSIRWSAYLAMPSWHPMLTLRLTSVPRLPAGAQL